MSSPQTACAVAPEVVEHAVRVDRVVPRVAEITAPTLVICGADDTATPLPRSEELHAAIAGSELVVIPGAGHHSALERPQPVAAAIERFLARIGY
jgi:3-oxoadipate enol-lactonase